MRITPLLFTLFLFLCAGLACANDNKRIEYQTEYGETVWICGDEDGWLVVFESDGKTDAHGTRFTREDLVEDYALEYQGNEEDVDSCT